MNVSQCFGTADPHTSHVARFWQKNCFTNWGESFWMSPCNFHWVSGDVFCLFCSCSCTQVTPVTALTRLKSDRVSATQVQPGPLSCSLCPPRYPLGPLFGPPQYHLGPLSRPRFPLWSPQVLPQPSCPWSPPPWSWLSALTLYVSPSFFQCNALESKDLKGRLGPRVRHVTFFWSKKAGWGPMFVT